MSEPYKIYTLHDPDTLEVRYVGFTSKTLKRRLAGHILSSRWRDDHRANWIQSLVSNGKSPEILLVESVSEENWKDREVFWISHFRLLGCDLTNSCDGGEGAVNPSKETRSKIGAAHRGKVISSEQREKLRAANLGKVMSCEARKKMSIAHKGRVFSAETRAKLMVANLGKRHTAEARAKMRAAQSKNTISPETRAKMGAALRGRPLTCQHRSKIGESNKRPIIDVDTGKEFCSCGSAALELGVSASTISKLIKTGRFVFKIRRGTVTGFPVRKSITAAALSFPTISAASV